LHAKSSRSVRRALHATGAAVGHTDGDDVPTLKRARALTSAAGGGAGVAFKTLDLNDDDQVPTTSSASRTHHINHFISFEKSSADSAVT